MINDKYEVVIGLEVHAQLLTKSKLFSDDSISFGAAPNTHVSPISLAHPGTLPVINKEVIALGVKLGIAINCNIAQHNYFARKNYFYTDLPKGYQTSQHNAPSCNGGYLTVQTETGSKSIKLNRIHMEEGSLRCDANISVRLKGETTLGTRVEVKNLNSICNVKKAIEIEADRLIGIVKNGGTVVKETRSFNADNNSTFSLRNKEDADDYRYFPEPDLPPLVITNEYIQAVKETMPELPAHLQQKFITEQGLSAYEAAQVCIDKDDVALYEKVAERTGNYIAAANWVTGPIRKYCNENNLSIKDFPLSPEKITELIQFTETGKIHFNTASTRLMEALISNSDSTAETLALSMNLLQENDTDAISKWIDETIMQMPDKVKEYNAGKKGLIGLFAGQVKKLSKGRADIGVVTKMLEERLQGSGGSRKFAGAVGKGNLFFIL
ncbi:MAG: Asp-tRNA(Asn)/Glu-tRNA(Gln) amidotransferase subunit GatB [Ferruginibacter sp.]